MRLIRPFILYAWHLILYHITMPRISVSIIGFNEALFLKECLESVKWADEIVYVDCGSSDNSIQIAASFNAKIFKRENDFNINVNKQFAIEQCSGDWILYLDPDETVPVDLKKEIISKMENDGGFAAFFIPRKNYYFGRWLKYGGKYPDRQLRFFKKGCGRFPCVNIHERLEIKGKVGCLKSAMAHNVADNVDWFIDKIKSYAYRRAIQDIRLNKTSKNPVLSAFKKFFRAYIIKLGFMDGPVGFFSAVTDCFNEMIFWLKRKELEKSKKF